MEIVENVCLLFQYTVLCLEVYFQAQKVILRTISKPSATLRWLANTKGNTVCSLMKSLAGSSGIF